MMREAGRGLGVGSVVQGRVSGDALELGLGGRSSAQGGEGLLLGGWGPLDGEDDPWLLCCASRPGHV